MIRIAALAIAALIAGPAAAQGVFVSPPGSVVDAQQLTGKRARVAHELRLMGFYDADVGQLSNARLALVDNALHGGGSQGDRASRVRSILSGGGFLQRAIDRIGRGG